MLQVGLGGSLQPGLYLHALAPMFGTSLGYMGNSAYVGSDYGYTFGWHQAGYGMIIGGEVVRAEFGQSVDGFIDRPLHQTYATQSQIFFMNLVVTDQRIDAGTNTLSFRRAELALHLLVVGASVGVDFYEIFDFGAGLFGFDPLNDDGREPAHAPFPVPDPNAPAPKIHKQKEPEEHVPEPFPIEFDTELGHEDIDP